jgi:hypothetical protein
VSRPDLAQLAIELHALVAVERDAFRLVELDRLGLERRLVERHVRERLRLLGLPTDEAADRHVA